VTPFDPVPVALDGPRVRLEPLDLARHWEGLRDIGLDPALWRWTAAIITNEAELRRYLETALAEQRAGRALPFATIDRASGRVAGCTRFAAIEPAHGRVEIGWTWLGREFQRTHVNTGSKYLMLRHAFESWGCQRVELKTHVLNERSRAAMRRIGCVEEGVLRKHMRNERGESRDTVYYSIIDDEWPAVQARLERMITETSGGRT
jgi:N-acetyltransferase